jgi:hypothetical protein
MQVTHSWMDIPHCIVSNDRWYATWFLTIKESWHVTPNLVVTKEIMSRGPQIADMECREPNGQSIAAKDPSFSMMHSTHHEQQQHLPHRPSPKRKWVLLHEVMSLGIMVSVSQIFVAFEHVAKDIS